MRSPGGVPPGAGGLGLAALLGLLAHAATTAAHAAAAGHLRVVLICAAAHADCGDASSTWVRALGSNSDTRWAVLGRIRIRIHSATPGFGLAGCSWLGHGSCAGDSLGRLLDKWWSSPHRIQFCWRAGWLVLTSRRSFSRPTCIGTDAGRPFLHGFYAPPSGLHWIPG